MTTSPVTVPDERYVTLPGLADRVKGVAEPNALAFWQGIEAGKLVLAVCPECSFCTQLPVAGCPSCPDSELEAREVPARGTIYSFTVCYREFGPGMTVPYIIGLVDLDAAPGCRLVTNVVNTAIRVVRPGLAVRGVFADSPPYLFFEPA
jgi:uncharacterized protein